MRARGSDIWLESLEFFIGIIARWPNAQFRIKWQGHAVDADDTHPVVFVNAIAQARRDDNWLDAMLNQVVQQQTDHADDAI